MQIARSPGEALEKTEVTSSLHPLQYSFGLNPRFDFALALTLAFGAADNVASGSGISEFSKLTRGSEAAM